MKNEIIRIVEESWDNIHNVGKDYKFAILLKPKDDSLEVKEWSKIYGFTDREALQRADNLVIQKMRMNAAVEVFRQFYEDTYLTAHQS